MRLWMILILPILLVACSDFKKNKQLDQINDLKSTVDSLEGVWSQENLSEASALFDQCSRLIDSISLLYQDQLLDLESAKKIDVIKRCHHQLDDVLKLEKLLPTILVEKKSSLLKLKNDVEHGKGRREKYDEYIQFEKDEMATIRKQFSSYHDKKMTCVKEVESHMTEIDSILMVLHKDYSIENKINTLKIK
ncbi:MAG TPA: hypothetical protein VKZ44_02260 [Taishania sp.]|nr:hypothetical protein [Taishania sp.]